MPPAPNTPAPSAQTLLQVRGLSFSHGPMEILRDVNLDIARGRITAIVGPTGCGKSTLLHILGGQWRPAAGQVLFDGTDVHAISRRALFKLRRRMGMMFQ